MQLFVAKRHSEYAGWRMTVRCLVGVFFVCFSLTGDSVCLGADPLRLWYEQPAQDWMTEALPIGNGYMGAMIFGGVDTEHIQLNEESLWAGGPAPGRDYRNGNRQGASEALPQVRELVKAKQFSQAHALARQKLTGVTGKSAAGLNFGDFGAYQSLGDLYVKVAHEGAISHYSRDLDIERAVAQVRYRAGGIQHERRSFASYPDRVMVFRFQSDDPDGSDYEIKLDNPHVEISRQFQGQELVVKGQVKDNGMGFASHLRIRHKGGTLRARAGVLHVTGTRALTLLLTAATDYTPDYPHYRGRDFQLVNRQTLDRVKVKAEEALLADHVADYQGLFNRVTLDLGQTPAARRPTNKRLEQYYEGIADPALETLFFQYGRYLLISSSRPGSLPANLQGKWNNKNNPPWACDYHTNINLQMNYWPAEATNLSECHLPLIDYMQGLVAPGRISAREHFNARGWIVCTMNNAFGYTAPGWGFPWGFFPGGAAWLCQHAWEHYAFTGDRAYLRQTSFPLMQEAALFWLDYLVEDEQGYLVSLPSYSPEHGGISAGASMDHQMVWDLFTNCVAACDVLENQGRFREQLTSALKKLSPPRIGRWGQLQEWLEDVDDPKNQHRHVSHLFALHPGKQISVQETPELAQAARTSLEARGDGGTGWSLAWKINFWARLQDGEHAHRMLRRLLRPTGQQGTDMTNGGGTYRNLFDAHPPFQIDGNFGATAGMAEMLVQSHANEIHLLPALPQAWQNGHVRGLCARGGFVIDMQWKAGALEQATILSKLGKSCQVRFQDRVVTLTIPAGQSVRVNENLKPI
jgi:alpha-L-fucosidase 2